LDKAQSLVNKFNSNKDPMAPFRMSTRVSLKVLLSLVKPGPRLPLLPANNSLELPRRAPLSNPLLSELIVVKTESFKQSVLPKDAAGVSSQLVKLAQCATKLKMSVNLFPDHSATGSLSLQQEEEFKLFKDLNTM
jgi:hypothetical protein